MFAILETVAGADSKLICVSEERGRMVEELDRLRTEHPDRAFWYTNDVPQLDDKDRPFLVSVNMIDFSFTVSIATKSSVIGMWEFDGDELCIGVLANSYDDAAENALRSLKDEIEAKFTWEPKLVNVAADASVVR